MRSLLFALACILLYDLSGANHLASAEFKRLLDKVPTHSEGGKIRIYIKDLPVQ